METKHELGKKSNSDANRVIIFTGLKHEAGKRMTSML